MHKPQAHISTKISADPNAPKIVERREKQNRWLDTGESNLCVQCVRCTVHSISIQIELHALESRKICSAYEWKKWAFSHMPLPVRLARKRKFLYTFRRTHKTKENV